MLRASEVCSVVVFLVVFSVVMVLLLPPCWWLFHLRGLYHEMGRIVQRSDEDSFRRILVCSGFAEFASRCDDVVKSSDEPVGSDCYWRKLLMALSLWVRPPGKPRIYHPSLRENGVNRPFAGLPRRGGCSESCLSVSTGTCRCKAWARSLGPIPTFDPMDPPNPGRPRHTSVCDCCSF